MYKKFVWHILIENKLEPHKLMSHIDLGMNIYFHSCIDHPCSICSDFRSLCCLMFSCMALLSNLFRLKFVLRNLV